MKWGRVLNLCYRPTLSTSDGAQVWQSQYDLYDAQIRLRERHNWLMREQEAHGPHCSPEKTVQINKHMIIIMLLKRRKTDNLLYEKWIVLHLNKLESPSSKGALCQVWLKLAQWFWRRRWKCEKFTTTITTTTTTTTDNGQTLIRKAPLSLRLRLAKKEKSLWCWKLGNYL